jgi:hypothetical protein
MKRIDNEKAPEKTGALLSNSADHIAGRLLLSSAWFLF